MPTPDKFLRAFGLTKGAKFGNYKIATATATHETIERYQIYQYHIRIVLSPLTLSSDDEMDKTDRVLIQAIKGYHDVKATRNYYRCTIDLPQSYYVKSNGDIEYNLVGHGRRI